MKKTFITLAICFLATLSFSQTYKKSGSKLVKTETVISSDTLTVFEIKNQIKEIETNIEARKKGKKELDASNAKDEAILVKLKEMLAEAKRLNLPEGN